jgi:hypothetical protein
MKKAPTLADAMIREWSRPLYRRALDPNNVIAQSIAKARKFVLDANMSAFMADLAYASLLTCHNTGKAHKLLDGMRQLARLPHDLTWIEYDFHAKAQRAVHEYGATINLNPEQRPDKCGWICWQHPTLPTAFMAVECSSQSFNQQGEKQGVPQATPFAYGWRTEDGPPPWASMPVRGHAHPEGYLTGIMSYRSDSVRVIAPPHLPREFIDYYLEHTAYNPLKEVSSDLRYLWALLATINDLPTKMMDVRSAKGYIGRHGKYHKFVDHKVIHLTVPAKAYKRVAQRAIAIARRRAHDVRGHWRRHWMHRPATFCEHRWEAHGNDVSCPLCGGKRIWIPSHQRGDASLGFVMHDYNVEHPHD